MLFSEPKIPQCSPVARCSRRAGRGFSALQRAENSSISPAVLLFPARTKFQCSSASRKFLNNAQRPGCAGSKNRFQCSSASRKFLNRRFSTLRFGVLGFSALQRAENSSILPEKFSYRFINHVSVLFSEPKIPQSTRAPVCQVAKSVSVLFSEPKIPQSSLRTAATRAATVSVLFSEPKIPQLL